MKLITSSIAVLALSLAMLFVISAAVTTAQEQLVSSKTSSETYDRVAISRPRSKSAITIPATKFSVTIDGQCDTYDEWSYASAYEFSDASGVTGTILLMQDDTNLYVCLEGYYGLGDSRFVSVYLDTDDGQELYSSPDDLALSVRMIDGITNTAIGNSESGSIFAEPSYTPTVPIMNWTAVLGDSSSVDRTEYAIPLTLTGGLCNVPFGVAVYHHWVNGSSGDDYGWPSNQYYDYPFSWVTAQFTQSPCPRDAAFSDVPPEFQRRAAEYLEDHRGSLSAPGWDMATLDSGVRLLYRPGITGVAYYEFPVIAPEGLGVQASGTISAGFIILSTGDHDFPIAHWNFAGESPTQEMERKAQAAGKRVARFFKLDTLAYAAEDATGALVAQSDTPLFKITGMDPSWLTNPLSSTEALWTPNSHPNDDSGAGTVSGTLVITGPKSAPLTFSAWNSWNELKAGYNDSYGVLAEFLRRDAAPDWRIAISMTNIGVILQNGESYTMPLLGPAPIISMEGIGLAYILTETVTRPGLPDAIRFTATDAEPGMQYPLTLTAEYTSFTEIVRILVLENYKIHLPLVLNNSTGSLAAQAVDSPLAVTEWSPWNVWWAGSGADQRLYNQIPPHQAPNTWGCNSGCGATAWAMLFGWADHQAALGNPVWVGRWGIYRQNGGYGANVDAPSTMDSGVKNMIWEIANRIGTWCAGSSGPTVPWTMSNAAYYLAWRSPVRLDTHFNSIGIRENRLQQYAGNSIVNRHTPAVIGTGWFTHYPLAYGYAWSRRPAAWYEPGDWVYDIRFYVNNGWGGSGNGWVPASTWFAGEIYP